MHAKGTEQDTSAYEGENAYERISWEKVQGIMQVNKSRVIRLIEGKDSIGLLRLMLERLRGTNAWVRRKS